MNSYNDAPIYCEDCGKIIDEHSGYTIPQAGLCNECASKPHMVYATAQQGAQRTCAQCGANDWRDAIIPDTAEICNRCGASR